MKFEKRTAVITGAAGRIGQALAREFTRYGVRIRLTDINTERMNAFAEELKREGADVRTTGLDVTDPESIRNAAETIISEAGTVDILVNNAGAWPAASLLELSDELWLKTIDLNLTSVYRMTKAFAAHMVGNGYGRIINLGSIAGEVGLPGRIAYSAAKAGVIMFTKTLAMELAGTGVTVNCISPGMIGDSKLPNNGTWLGCSGTGDDVARAIAFLAADDSDYITGVDLPVDGGRILGPLNSTFRPPAAKS